MDLNVIAQKLQMAGFNVRDTDLKVSGKWESAKTFDNKAGAKSGRYIIGDNICSWINNKTQDKGSFVLDKTQIISGFDLAKKRREYEKAERDKYFNNAIKAKDKYNAIKTSPEYESEYLERKESIVDGCKIDKDGNVVIPLRSLDLKPDGTIVSYIRSLQTILPDGTKLLEPGCEKKGNMHILGYAMTNYKPPKNYKGDILVAEGYATATSIHLATGKPVVVAIDAGNLDPVMAKLTKVYPNAKFTICADNDRLTELKTGRNPGVEAAKLCQEKYGCSIAIPDFSHVPDSQKLTDFNDLLCSTELFEVLKQVSSFLPTNDNDKNSIGFESIANVLSSYGEVKIDNNIVEASSIQLSDKLKSLISDLCSNELTTKTFSNTRVSEFTLNSNTQISFRTESIHMHGSFFDETDTIYLKGRAIYTCRNNYQIKYSTEAINEVYKEVENGKLMLSLQNGMDVNARLPNGETVLTQAVKDNNSSLIKNLIEHGAIINYLNDKGQSAISIATQKNNLELVDYLESEKLEAFRCKEHPNHLEPVFMEVVVADNKLTLTSYGGAFHNTNSVYSTNTIDIQQNLGKISPDGLMQFIKTIDTTAHIEIANNLRAVICTDFPQRIAEHWSNDNYINSQSNKHITSFNDPITLQEINSKYILMDHTNRDKVGINTNQDVLNYIRTLNPIIVEQIEVNGFIESKGKGILYLNQEHPPTLAKLISLELKLNLSCNSTTYTPERDVSALNQELSTSVKVEQNTTQKVCDSDLTKLDYNEDFAIEEARENHKYKRSDFDRW